MDRTFAEDVLSRAVVVLGDVRADDDDREHAALVIGTLLRNGCAYPSEADLADLFSALGRARDVYLAVRRVLDGVQRLRPDAVVEKVGRGVERLMDRAYRDGDYEALCELILVALEDVRWARLIHDERGRAAMVWAANQLPERKYTTSLIISGWLHVLGKVPPWLGELAEAHPHLVTSSVLPAATRWQLHCAAPSVAGWRHLAGARGTPTTVEPAIFGEQADIAIETLTVALGENTNETKRTVLRRWLHELTGTTP